MCVLASLSLQPILCLTRVPGWAADACMHVASVCAVVCCAVRGDLIRTINKLLKRRNKFDAIIIETTGLANPAPVIQVGRQAGGQGRQRVSQSVN